MLLLLCLTAGVLPAMGTTNMAADKQELTCDLSGERLAFVPFGVCGANVTKLLIEDNLIALNETDRRALAGFPRLEELYLGGNRIAAVPDRFFSGLANLRVLSLTRNNIERLDRRAFAGLVSLRELDLSHNKLTELPVELLTGAAGLQVLNLQENPWDCDCPAPEILVASGNLSFGSPNVLCASPVEQKGKKLVDAAALCKEASPVLGNAWKFTACVAALAFVTSALILTAVKAPSCYKRFHSYRHRRLDYRDFWVEEEEADRGAEPN